MTVHIVQKGDTLWKIAKQHDVSFDQLKRMNAHLANPEYIVPGMKVNVPSEKNVTAEQESISLDKSKRAKAEVPKETPVEKKEEGTSSTAPPKASPKAVEKKESPPEKINKTENTRPAPSKERPITPPLQPQPAPQMSIQPIQIIGIPCGWMPIYDADCVRGLPMYPMHEAFPHTRHMQHHHHPEPMTDHQQHQKHQKPQNQLAPNLEMPLPTPQPKVNLPSIETKERPMPQLQQPKQKAPTELPPKINEPVQKPIAPPVPMQQPSIQQPQYNQQFTPYIQQPYPMMPHQIPAPSAHCAYCQSHHPSPIYGFHPAPMMPYWPTPRQ